MELENLITMGVDLFVKWGAVDSFPASVVGENVPLIRIPLP